VPGEAAQASIGGEECKPISLQALLVNECPALLDLLTFFKEEGCEPRLIYLERRGVVLRDQRAD